MRRPQYLLAGPPRRRAWTRTTRTSGAAAGVRRLRAAARRHGCVRRADARRARRPRGGGRDALDRRARVLVEQRVPGCKRLAAHDERRHVHDRGRHARQAAWARSTRSAAGLYPDAIYLPRRPVGARRPEQKVATVEPRTVDYTRNRCSHEHRVRRADDAGVARGDRALRRADLQLADGGDEEDPLPFRWTRSATTRSSCCAHARDRGPVAGAERGHDGRWRSLASTLGKRCPGAQPVRSCCRSWRCATRSTWAACSTARTRSPDAVPVRPLPGGPASPSRLRAWTSSPRRHSHLKVPAAPAARPA